MDCQHQENDWQWRNFCANCGAVLQPFPLDLHPQQPIRNVDQGVERFRANAIVRYLLDNGGIDLNDLAVMPFPREDLIQFAQLIGYSVSGFGELNYVDEASYQEAIRPRGETEVE